MGAWRCRPCRCRPRISKVGVTNVEALPQSEYILLLRCKTSENKNRMNRKTQSKQEVSSHNLNLPLDPVFLFHALARAQHFPHSFKLWTHDISHLVVTSFAFSQNSEIT